MGEWARKVQAVDDKHFCYLNLFPNGGKEHLDALGVQSYREYVSRFDREVPMQFLSFDHYPITYDGMKPEWYENLEEFSDESKKGRQGFLGVRHGYQALKYPHPTLATLRLQMFSDLAYGAQGLQYFTYWRPVNSEVSTTSSDRSAWTAGGRSPMIWCGAGERGDQGAVGRFSPGRRSNGCAIPAKRFRAVRSG